MDGLYSVNQRRRACSENMKLLLTNTTCLILLLYISSLSLSEQSPPYKDFSDDGAHFYGHGRELDVPENLKAVYIGLVGPGKTPEGEQFRNGVAIAIEEANARGGYGGIPYKTIFRPDDGPWGVAAKQVVRLAYEDKVWVILGALEGKHAHLAELVSAKAWVPILTPTAIDLSIDYANVPWMFRFAPDDGRQARVLLRHAHTRGYKRLVVLTAGEREARTGFLRIKEASSRERHPIAMHIEYDPNNATAVLPRFQDITMDAILIWGGAKSAISLLQRLHKENIQIPILLPASLAIAEIEQAGGSMGEIIVAAPFDMSRNDEPILTFKQKYQERTESLPSPIAFLAYDASRVAIAALERAGLNRVRIRDEVARMSFKGITGQIQFDSLGGNTGEPALCTIQDGQWIRLAD